MCTAQAKYGEGLNLSSFFFMSSAFVHRYTKRLRLMSSAAMRWISGWISGSPPAIDTIGAPDSSIAATACSTGMRCLRMWAGYWILPQPTHARLQAKSGSSSTSRGNLSRWASFCFSRYAPIRRLCRSGTAMSTNLLGDGETHRLRDARRPLRQRRCAAAQGAQGTEPVQDHCGAQQLAAGSVDHDAEHGQRHGPLGLARSRQPSGRRQEG